jgi:acyl carrier protein
MSVASAKSATSAAERDMAQLLVTALNLEGVDATAIDPDAPLFGHEAAGLGLDSIDALEIALAVEQKYGVELRADDRDNKQVFSSLRALNAHVHSRRMT